MPDEKLTALLATDWFAERPEPVRRAIVAYPPTQRYLMRETHQIVEIYSYAEDDDGTVTRCTVTILGRMGVPEEMQAVFSGYRVFGVPLTDLTPFANA